MNRSEYKSFSEWREAHPKDYQQAYTKGYLDSICEHFGWEKPIIKKPSGYWTKERCLEESKKYKTRLEWRKNSSSSYGVTKKNKKWLVDICEYNNWKLPTTYIRKPNGYWTKERCIEDGLNYKSIAEWRKKSPIGYEPARENGWLDECTVHMEIVKRGGKYWTKERCIEDAKKYNGRWEWQKAKTGYNVAKIKGWLDECCEHMTTYVKPPGYWNNKELVLSEARKYKYIVDFEKGNRGAHSASRRYGWYEEATAHMEFKIKPRGYWNNKELVLSEAKKFKTLEEFKHGHYSAHGAARRNDWMKDCKQFFTPPKRWTVESILENSKQHKNKTEWQKSFPGAFNAARKFGIFEEATTHMVAKQKPNGYWNNKEKCLEESKKYLTKTEWAKKSYASLKWAQKNDWFNECVSHMKKYKNDK